MASPNTLKMRGNPPGVPSTVRVIIDINPVTGQSTLSTSGPVNQLALAGVLLAQMQVLLENIAKASMGIIDPNKPRGSSTGTLETPPELEKPQ